MDWREIEFIARNEFQTLKGPPKRDALGFPSGNEFDSFIRGWSKYWNDIFQSNDPLDPNFVKALIATESSFVPDITNKILTKTIKAMGLMQIREETRKILGDPRGELRDYLLIVPRSKIMDPNTNICAGIRWLFRKKEILQGKKSTPVSWVSVVSSYKGKGSEVQMKKFEKLYQQLKKI